METLCVVPARKGSKRLPGKNKLKIGGIPLYQKAYFDKEDYDEAKRRYKKLEAGLCI